MACIHLQDMYYSITLFLSLLINHKLFNMLRDDHQVYIIIVHKKEHWQNLNLRVIGIGISTYQNIKIHILGHILVPVSESPGGDVVNLGIPSGLKGFELPAPRSGYATTIMMYFCPFTHRRIPRSPPKFNQFFIPFITF